MWTNEILCHPMCWHPLPRRARARVQGRASQIACICNVSPGFGAPVVVMVVSIAIPHMLHRSVFNAGHSAAEISIDTTAHGGTIGNMIQ